MVKKYFISYGPDSRHLIDGKDFKRLKDAKWYASKLSQEKAYKITSLEFPHSFSVGQNEKVILENIKQQRLNLVILKKIRRRLCR